MARPVCISTPLAPRHSGRAFDVKTNPSQFKVGDKVRVVRIPSDLDDRADIDTPGVFKRALGRKFLVEGFDQYGNVELRVTRDDTIWIEPEFLSLDKGSAKK